MAERSPKHELTRSGRGWYARVAGQWKWVCSLIVAPTGADADRIFEDKFKDLANPPAPTAALTVADLFDHFVAHKQVAEAAGNLSPRTVGDYIDAGQRFADAVGADLQAGALGPRHFTAFAEAIATYSPHRRAKLVVVVRGAFKWAAAAGLVPIVTAQFAAALRVPRRAEFRLHRRDQGEKLYSPGEVRTLLKKASKPLAAMILLALNGGFGNADLGGMRKSDVHVDRIRLHRAKTGIERTVPLWNRTKEALRKLPTDPSALVFVHPDTGGAWVDESGRSHRDRIAVAFAELCAAARVPNRGFYSLRRTFRTIADEAGDQRAAAALMGHESGDMGGIYVQRITFERLKKVTDFVEAQLFHKRKGR